MDVRAFMEHMAGGRQREAREILERHVPLQEILARICDHPCETRCLRRDLGGSLAIGALESLCMDMTDKQGKSFPRPPKLASIAVLGNALAGLVVASELSKKAYPVTIFHEGDAHGALLRRFPQLAEENFQREYDALVKTGCTFTQHPLARALFEEAKGGFTAVFVDADAAAGIFAALGARPDPATGLVVENICAGGMLEQSPTGELYASSSKQAGEGRRAAATLERYVTGVSLTAERDGELVDTSPLRTPLDKVKVQEAVLPHDGTYTPEEAVREAARCIPCECLACVRECVYLQKYGSYPRSYARQIYNNASIVQGEHLANALINGCTLCGQCTELCPERFSMAELCLSARRDMVKRAYMPPSAHEFALEDMENANSASCALFMADPAEQKNVYAFFPGCQLAASRGEQVLRSYAYLRESVPAGTGVGLFLACCGAPAYWSGNEETFQTSLARIRREWETCGKPTLIMACASCVKIFRDAAPDMPLISLWEMLDRRYANPPSPPAEKTYCIHDPCAARHDAAWQQAVRGLAVKCGIKLEEPRRTGHETACCGYGGLVWNAQPELADAITRRRAHDLEKPALASCIMCRDRFVSIGKECLHLLDILPFSKMDDAAHAAFAPPPGLSVRRANRAALRQRVRLQYHGDEPTPVAYRVVIGPTLLVELERKHIVRDDVEQAVLAVEAAKTRFFECRSGQYVGSWRPRNVTFWVRYSINTDGSYTLHDAWSHRMVVPNTGGTKVLL
jgi:Fe-S oxidoreductase